MNKNKLKSNLLNLENSSFSEVISFIKRSSCYLYSRSNKNSELFWQSNLPVKWFNDLIKEPFLEDFLFGYFSKEENVNEQFLSLLINSNKKSTLIKVIKLTESFAHCNHWNSFTIFKRDFKLKQFYGELRYIKDYRQYWNSELAKYIVIIESMDYEDICIQMISYYEQFKRYSEKTKDNRSLIISYEAQLISILNIILNLKKEFVLDSKLDIANKYNSKEFSCKAKEQLPEIRPGESHQNSFLIPREKINEQKAKFRSVVDFLLAKGSSDYQIKNYLTGLADFEYIDGLDSELAPNSKFDLYRRTLEKGTYDEVYFNNRIIEKAEGLKEIKKLPNLWEKQFKLSIASSKEYFKFLKIPLLIDDRHSNSKIDIEKVLLFLKTFSNFMIPQGRLIIYDNDGSFKGSLKRVIPEHFKKLFDSDYIVSYEETELISKCKEYFNWTKEDIIMILNFLTTDLSTSRRFNIDFTTRPMIKIGKQYIWLSSFLRDCRWEVLLHKKIVADNNRNLKLQPANTEKFIADLFREVNFDSIASYCYEHNNLKGEIDVLAFKENTLFLFELKSTYVEEDIMKTSKYETLKFNSKASDQLNKAKDYVLSNFEEIKAIEELNVNCKKKDLKIVTLIISNIYQSDNLIFNNEHVKISLFELLIILKNDLYNMLVPKIGKALFDSEMKIPIDSILNMLNKSNPNYTKNSCDINEKDCNLWKDKNNCMPNDILTAIKDNKVWKHQDLNKIFKTGNIELTKFNDDHKYLA